MTCPYLKEVTMVFCRAFPVKKLVPLDQVSPESRCDGDDQFRRCPLYRDALVRLERATRALDDEPECPPTAAPKGAQS
jgi:hypothetical protein